MIRVLLVDDDNAVLRVLAEGLTTGGFTVVPVLTLEQAKLMAGPWNLLIVDRKLPDGDGFTLCELWPGIPSITISGQPPADLIKPFSLRELVMLAKGRLGLSHEV